MSAIVAILDFKIGSNLKDVIFFAFYIFDYVLATDFPINDSFDSYDCFPKFTTNAIFFH